MELFSVLIGLTVKSRLIWPRVNEDVPTKPKSLLGCFIIMSQDTLVVFRTDRGMMFFEDPVSTIALLNSKSLM